MVGFSFCNLSVLINTMNTSEPTPSSDDRELSTQEDLGYITPSQENAKWMKKYLAGDPPPPPPRDPRVPDEDWRLTKEEKETGIEKLAQTRQYLETKAKQRSGQPLSQAEIELITRIETQADTEE